MNDMSDSIMNEFEEYKREYISTKIEYVKNIADGEALRGMVDSADLEWAKSMLPTVHRNSAFIFKRMHYIMRLMLGYRMRNIDFPSLLVGAVEKDACVVFLFSLEKDPISQPYFHLNIKVFCLRGLEYYDKLLSDNESLLEEVKKIWDGYNIDDKHIPYLFNDLKSYADKKDVGQNAPFYCSEYNLSDNFIIDNSHMHIYRYLSDIAKNTAILFYRDIKRKGFNFFE